MTSFVGKIVFSLRIYTVPFIRFILADLIFKAKIFMLEKAVSRLQVSALIIALTKLIELA